MVMESSMEVARASLNRWSRSSNFRTFTGEAIVSATDFWAAFLTSFLGPIAPWIFISATTSSRAKTPLTTLCAE